MKKPFNNPFAWLKLKPPANEKPRADQLDLDAETPTATATSTTTTTSTSTSGPTANTTPASGSTNELNDEELWQLATEGASPLRDRSARVRPRKAAQALPLAPLDPELHAYDELRALVAGEAPFDIADTDEFIEGAARGLDARILRRLRRGEYAVQGHVDLHGLTRAEARAELEAFLARSRQAGKRCVLVVHGRGLHSKDQVPILKDSLRRWMSMSRFAAHVLAFATARPHDGGLGAVYVLLRRG